MIITTSPMGHCWDIRGEAQTSPGTVWSRTAQSAQFRGKRVCSIIHAACYFHHMLLSGIIVIPATSAQTALCSYCYQPFPSLRLFIPFTLFHYLMELALEAPLTGPLWWRGGWSLLLQRWENGSRDPCIISHSKWHKYHQTPQCHLEVCVLFIANNTGYCEAGTSFVVEFVSHVVILLYFYKKTEGRISVMQKIAVFLFPYK